MAATAPTLVASLLAVRLLDEWFSFVPTGSLEPVRADLGLGYDTLALLLALPYLGGVVGGIFAVAADRVSRRVQATFGALGYAASMACWGLSDELWVLATGSVLLGLSSDALISACEVALVDIAGDDLVATLAPSTVAAEVGDLLGPLLLAGVAAAGWSWRVAFLLGAAVFTVYAVVLAFQPLPAPRRDVGAQPRTVRGDVSACLRDRRVWQLALVSLLFDALDEPFLGFAIAYLEVERGQTHGVAVLVGGSVVVGGVLGATALAVRGGGASPQPPAASAVLLALAVLGIIVAPAIPLQIAAGLLAGGASAVFWTRVQARMLGLRPGQAGTTAAVVGYLALPGALWPLVAAAAAERFGLGTALGCYLVVAVLLAIVTARLTDRAAIPSVSE